MNKSYLPFVAIFLGLSVGTLIFGRIFFHSPQFLLFQQWVHSHVLLFSISLFLIKVIGIVWPPLPGGIFTLSAVPLMGWKLAFSIDLLGNLVGSLLAFGIARRYGKHIVEKLFPKSALATIEKVKLKEKHEFEAIFLMSLLTGIVMAEVASYGFGLLPVKKQNFIFGNLAAHIARNAPLFIWFGTITGRGSGFIALILLAIAVPLLIIARNRYFEILHEDTP